MMYYSNEAALFQEPKKQVIVLPIAAQMMRMVLPVSIGLDTLQLIPIRLDTIR